MNLSENELKHEEWKDVPVKPYDKRYQVSNMGRIRRKRYVRYQKCYGGGLSRHVYPDKVSKRKGTFAYFGGHSFRIDRLVVSAFVHKLTKHDIVRHVNNNKNDSRVCNLKYYSIHSVSYPNEIWKPVPIKPFDKLYLVSNYGRVFSKSHITSSGNYIHGRIKRQDIRTGNYLYVRLYHCANFRVYSKSYRVHRLVGKAFIPNPHHYPEINHKDENKHNNKVSNLEWCTSLYNVNYGTRNKRSALHQKGSAGHNIQPVILIRNHPHLFSSEKNADKWLRQNYNCQGDVKFNRRHYYGFTIIKC